VFPGLAGLPPAARNMEQLMTLLTRMEQLPSSHVPGTVEYGGGVPINYAVRQQVEGQQTPSSSYSMKGVLKASQLAEDSAVTRNKGIATKIKTITGILLSLKVFNVILVYFQYVYLMCNHVVLFLFVACVFASRDLRE